jgi:glycine cleavage system H protein
MTEFLTSQVDKFTFKVATDRYYNSQGVWAKLEGALVRIGLSDFLQQRSGDVAFAEIRPPGTELAYGNEVGTIETIKVNVELQSPVSGRINEVNPVMEDAPEAINQDPYGNGWLAVIQAQDWEVDRSRLLDPKAYFDQMKAEAEEESKKI